MMSVEDVKTLKLHSHPFELTVVPIPLNAPFRNLAFEARTAHLRLMSFEMGVDPTFAVPFLRNCLE